MGRSLGSPFRPDLLAGASRGGWGDRHLLSPSLLNSRKEAAPPPKKKPWIEPP